MSGGRSDEDAVNLKIQFNKLGMEDGDLIDALVSGDVA